MQNETQLDRYKRLLHFIEKRFKDDIQINEIEEVSFYSYRNINRIFQSLQHETIGKYIRRLRLEKAAEYLKYSDMTVSSIGYEVGFGDLAVFSKAFRKSFGCSPSAFRENQRGLEESLQALATKASEAERTSLAFDIVEFPAVDILYLEYKGPHDQLAAIEQNWQDLLEYANDKGLIDDDTLLLGEILDDNEITASIHWRYRSAISLKANHPFEPEGLFQRKTLDAQTYAKFIHQGSHDSSEDTYNQIYATWMQDVQLELVDKPLIEILINQARDTPEDQWITEIYIPVMDAHPRRQ